RPSVVPASARQQAFSVRTAIGSALVVAFSHRRDASSVIVLSVHPFIDSRATRDVLSESLVPSRRHRTNGPKPRGRQKRVCGHEVDPPPSCRRWASDEFGSHSVGGATRRSTRYESARGLRGRG